MCLYHRVIFMASSSWGSCAVLKSFIHQRRRCEVGAKHVEQAYSSRIFIAHYMQLWLKESRSGKTHKSIICHISWTWNTLINQMTHYQGILYTQDDRRSKIQREMWDICFRLFFTVLHKIAPAAVVEIVCRRIIICSYKLCGESVISIWGPVSALWRLDIKNWGACPGGGTNNERALFCVSDESLPHTPCGGDSFSLLMFLLQTN